MEYSCSVEIDLPRDRVVALFDDPDNLVNWQKGFVSLTHVSGVAGRTGAKSELVYKMGKRDIVMVETITERNLPDTFSASYEAKGVWNSVENRFSETEAGHTIWHMDTLFKCTGFMRIMATLMPGMFRKQSNQMMRDFKAFAEASG